MGYTKWTAEQVEAYNNLVDHDTPDDWMQRINYIIKANSTFCNSTYTLYVETATQAALKLLINLYDFDDGDIVRWIFNPKGRVLRHGHKRNGTRRWVQKEANVNAISARKVTTGVKTLWRIDGFTQRLLFWWMVIDITTEFLYDWSSLLEETGTCAQHHGLADAPNQIVATVGAFQGGKWSNVISDSGSIAMGPGGAGCGGLDVNITLAMDLSFFTGPGSTTVTLRLTTTSGGVVSNHDQDFTVPVGGDVGALINIEVPKCTSAAGSIRTVGPGVKGNHGSFHIVGMDSFNK